VDKSKTQNQDLKNSTSVISPERIEWYQEHAAIYIPLITMTPNPGQEISASVTFTKL
jgi:hypothetical protein